ncbi:MAG: lysophospholipase [Lachnospiraceae bacterium]|nr:lysophospholipase [Lachnospiraceae bacterium]
MIWIICGILLLLALLGGFVYTWRLAGKIYKTLLVRQTNEQWGRVCSFPEDEEYSAMYEEALAWDSANAAKRQPVSVTSDGLRLAGEYYDFGADRAVIIIPGRTEACRYSCYFAKPYQETGCNVLVIDNRAHGLSEGKYPALGFAEYRDILAWGKLLHEQFGNRQIFLHGICIGASTAIFALTAKECPAYFAGMVADGMYTTFYESFKCHMIEDHHPVFPVAQEVMAQIRIYSGARPMADGPVKRIAKLERPILFLHSREDTFSLPAKAELLYNKCKAHKTLHFFDKGAHSRIRFHNREEYDLAVADFIGTV